MHVTVSNVALRVMQHPVPNFWRTLHDFVLTILGKHSLGRPWIRWEDNITYSWCKAGRWIALARDRVKCLTLVLTVLDRRFVVPQCLLMLQQHTFSLLKLILISVYFYTGTLSQTQNTVNVLWASDCWRRTRETFHLSYPACYTCRYNMITWFSAAESHSVSVGTNSYP
jgi:hypothetical protein